MHRNETIDTALDEYRRAHLAVIACVERMPESRYDQPFWGDDPPPQKTVIEKIAGDTYDHYREHTEWIAEILQPKANVT
jgi:hypothetical protein